MVRSVIRFKSVEENYLKEQSGLKSNTVRFVDDWNDERWLKYRMASHVKIVRKDNPKTFFVRKIKDKSQHKNVVIISW